MVVLYRPQMSVCKSSQTLFALEVLKGREDMCSLVCGPILQVVLGPLQGMPRISDMRWEEGWPIYSAITQTDKQMVLKCCCWVENLTKDSMVAKFTKYKPPFPYQELVACSSKGPVYNRS